MLLTSGSCHKGRFFFPTLVEILGYNEDPETRQDATELEWGYIHFPRNERREFGKCDEYCKSLVFRFRRSLIYSLFKTLAQLQTSWIVEQFYFFPMHFVWLLNARAPHRSKFYSTQLSMLVYRWISKRERRILRIQIWVISNTNGNIFNRWSFFRLGALKMDLLNFRWILQTEFVRVGV